MLFILCYDNVIYLVLQCKHTEKKGGAPTADSWKAVDQPANHDAGVRSQEGP